MPFTLEGKWRAQDVCLYIKSFIEDKRKLIPLLQLLGQVHILLESVGITFITCTVSLPDVRKDLPASILWGRFVMCFLCISALSNYFLIMRTARRSMYTCVGELPMFSTVQTEWNLCKHCNCHIPPRARHCHFCKGCILKRDHHCFFTACCIGFHNQRFFISFCFYSFIGLLYSLWFLGQYLTVQYAPFLSLEIYKYLLPYAAVRWTFGYLDSTTFFLLFVFYTTFTSCTGSLYFLLYQTMLIYKGQSNTEFLKGNKTYKTDMKNHLESIFGKYWLIGFLSPIPIFQSKNNGIHWDISSTKFI